MKRLIVFVSVLCAAVAVALPAGAATKTVTITEYKFTPKKRTVEKGDKVRFSWEGDEEHNVTFRKVPAGAKKPKKCGDRLSGTCARTLKKRGTFKFVCSIHELSDGMKGRIVVE